jgi:plastocyanin
LRLSATSRRKMVACNWLGEPVVTVHYDFDSKKMEPSEQRRHDSESVTGRGIKRTTHRVDAAGGPVTPLWEWDPSDLEIQVGHKVVWGNETASGHHVTPSGGPWKDVEAMHLPTDGKVGFVFDKPGEYLYRCDFAFAGVEHSFLVGDECIGMCGRVVVKKQRY